MTDPIRVERPGEFPRRFVPMEIDLGDWAQVEPLFKDLEARDLDSPGALERWLLDESELTACLHEEGSRRHVAMTCNTEDEEAERRHLEFVTELVPKIKPYGDRLNRKYLACPHREALDRDRHLVHDRDVENAIKLYREENVPLQTEEQRLENEHHKICGAQMVEFRGETKTIPQMAKYVEETDRELREEAWVAVAKRRLQDAEALSDLFDKLFALRHQMAKNAGFDNYRDYMHRAKGRFDYTPHDCLAFHDAVEKTFVPAMRRLDEERRERLGVDRLRPWDLNVDPLGRSPLRPFETADELVRGTRRILESVAPVLAEDFDVLSRHGLLDLASRRGKAPGGYQATLTEVRLPFIFMNAAGVNRDVFTLLHEGGHAFHALAAREEPLHAYRHAPLEFCEVASMGMEMMALDSLDRFYSAEEANRARRLHLEELLGIFPWIAQVDAFQHWLYTHPEHTRDERTHQWIALEKRFGRALDWAGHWDWRRVSWQRQLHIFQVPFYYIEYGIAQTGAIQLWLNHRGDAEGAIADYRRALALGGSRPLPELFEACGLRFDFTAETLAPLAEAVERELSQLPE